ncbi:unnamed protein product [Blepharisma stoltei]|uniref:Calcineurin-like phosphoesterase domain-containing protein n=1 Tax=Blepharisma stoltei TaxID=1481888 RepID=A0AAU9IGI8_9CILI|nr:unnamed protein product [Blepharisma stoltei]
MFTLKNLLWALLGVSVLFFVAINILSTNIKEPAKFMEFLPDAPLIPLQHDRIIAIGDLHGDYRAFLDILDFTDWRDGDTLIQLGDLLDKGDEAKNLLDYFVKNHNRRVKLLLGNHEELNLVQNFKYATDKDTQAFGGLSKRKELFMERDHYGSFLINRNLAEKIGDIVFVHGGISEEILTKFGSIEEINRASRDNPPDRNVLWSKGGPMWFGKYAREQEKWICDELKFVLKKLDAKFMVMGHFEYKEITMRCSGKAIFIDTGISKAVNGIKSAIEILQVDGNTMSIKAIYEDSEEIIFENKLD